MLIIVVILIFALTTLFHLLGNIIACFLTDIKIESIQIFYGKTLYKLQTNSLKIEIGYLPFGGSIKFTEQEYFSKLHIIKKILVILSGPILVILIAAVFINLQNSIIECVKGFEQIIPSCFSPIKLGTKLVGKFNLLIKENNFFYIFALLSTKISSFNLLPIPPLNGGQIIIEIFPFFRKIKRRIITFNLGFIICCGIILIWLYIIIYQVYSTMQ